MSSTFFHRTTLEAWEAIQVEGVLWGIPSPGAEYRYTYLSPEPFDESYGPVLLKVDYKPHGAGSGVDNFGFSPPPGQECWQFSVFVPIPVSAVTRVEVDGG